MSAMQRLGGVLSTAGLVGAFVVLAPAAAAQAPAPAPAATAGEVGAANADRVSWGRCSDPTLVQVGARCAKIEVPLDYDRPNGKTIKLAVSRVRHTTPDAQFQGIMLVNPGGPGGSGLILSILGGFVPGGAGDGYDWIGFDPRGVGASQGALSCDPGYFSYDRPAYIPTTPQLEKVWLDRSKAYARACGRKNGALLSNMRTTDAAKDMESIRRALGQEQINYYGFSYGTYLGQVYGTLFPERVRRMVLDSNVDPRRVWYPSQLDQDRGFDRNMKIYFQWLAENHDVYHLGATEAAVERLFYATQTDLDAHPAGGLIGSSEWNDIFLSAGYYIFGWEDLANAFVGWVRNGDWQTLKVLYDGAVGVGDDNGFAVYLAVQCTDARWPQSWDRWRDDSWRVYERAPFVTWGNTWFNAPCLYWPAPSGTPVEIDGSGVQSALLLGEELDAATPFEGSLEVRDRFPNASLIGGPGGTTHAASLFGNACVDDQVAAYLADGTLPPRQPGRTADTLCDPLPQPVPGAAASAATVQATAPVWATLQLREQLARQAIR